MSGTQRMGRGRAAGPVLALSLGLLGAQPAVAQEASPDGDGPTSDAAAAPDGGGTPADGDDEGGTGAPPPVPYPEPTRLDVERLPPEAIEVTRALYAHGLFLEAWLGGRGFVGGAGDLFDPGPFLNLGLGYEIFEWLWVRLAVEASLHTTDAPPPPSRTAFEILGAFVEARLQWNATARFALWVGGELGLAVALGDVLQSYGADDSDSVGLAYGGSLGADWHLRNRHYSLGLVAGARLYPTFDDPNSGDPAVGIHGAAYLRYVF